MIARLRRSRRHSSKRIATVKRRRGSREKGLAVELVGAGLGENLDAAVAELVVLRGKWILVDADFADGSFGRESSGGETVGINLTAVWAGRGAGKRLQFGLEFVGIIGERFEILALHDHRTGGVGRSDIDLGGGAGCLHFFLLDLNEEAN